MAAGRAFPGAPCSSLATGARRFAFASAPSRALTPALRCRGSVRCVASAASTSDAAPALEPYVLTTPLYYVNAPPHMGRAYTTIAADAIARFQRLLQKKVIFITGTDEHGEKNSTSAKASGRNPKEHCDTISSSYKMLWADLDIEYDKFIRTTDHKHEALLMPSILAF